LLRLDDEGHVPFLLVDDRSLHMTVVAIDAAGNTGAPVDVDDPDGPPGDGRGCAAVPPSISAALGLLLLLTRRR